MRQLPLLLLVALAGCARKLPGPAECRSLALESVGVRKDVPPALLEQRPALAERAEQVAFQCLTKPWDYELIGCLQSGTNQRLCAARFEQRRLSGTPSPLPRGL